MTVDPGGGVFVAVTGKGQRPAFSFGQGAQKDVLFTCPQSAIPDEVWDIVDLWNRCRLTGVLPAAGGLLDQPGVVQRFFPVLNAEYQAVTHRQGGPEAMAMAMLTAMKAAGGR